ncbi:DNA methyltransferase [Phormidium sp. CCY1219]|uniref:DNA methyltransferase n=1 Tax=Phormidium sp. CCY1219 TaxID=2886104 RepID=UPI002D1F1382|nr:DNA methyltransferase [Phormidium sp. CCY1219]MEB3826202.1 site-specific DNA-methyltransferase [Phormidium sp. CCY1219]
MRNTVKQRAEYTFKFNRNLGRHGWLRLTPAYGVKLVEKLWEYRDKNAVILDPFSGTATTGLVAAERGNQAFAFDINPFLVWLGNAKCQTYSPDCLTDIRQQVKEALRAYPNLIHQENWTPKIFRIERWWSASTLRAIAALRTALVEQFGEPSNNAYGLVWIAFCRLVIETSSAAFNHISMSFHNSVTHFEVEYVETLFANILDVILKSANLPLLGDASIVQADSRTITDLNGIKVDRVITSPPYPNRMSYIRELRPYMYWTKFLQEAKEAGEIDWQSIGGTWGIATSRLASWQIEEKVLPDELFFIVDRIQKTERKNAHLMGIYVLKYFHDMHLHLSALRNLLASGAKVQYAIGNSTFFGNKVDTPAIIAHSMKMLGYQQVRWEIIRKRNSNKALYEYCISAIWAG